MVDSISAYPSQQRTGNKGLFFVVGLVIIAALVGGFFMFKQPKKESEQMKAAVTEKETPTPTAKPKIDKLSVKIQVLNGTGTPGQAGTVADALKKIGFDTDNIKASNAAEFNNTITTIASKEGFDDIAVDIKEGLKTVFEELKIDSTNISKDNDFDIIITTGGKKFEQATPTTSTSTVTPTVTNTSTTPSPTVTTTTTPTITVTPTPTKTN